MGYLLKSLGSGILFVLLIFATAAILRYWFTQNVRAEAKALIAKAATNEITAITPEMLKGLPEPVQRHLKYAGVAGKPMVNTVYLKQKGKIRQNNNAAWVPIEAEQFYSVDPPGFIWNARMVVAGVPIVGVRDKYAEGKGNMAAKAAFLYTFLDVSGEEMDQGGMMRYLNEMQWFPAAYLSKNITWKAIDINSAEVTLTDKGRSVSGVLTFDKEGKQTNFSAKRYRESNGLFTLDKWETPITSYGEFEGVKMPVSGQAIWKLDTGDLAYIDLKVTELKYNKMPDMDTFLREGF